MFEKSKLWLALAAILPLCVCMPRVAKALDTEHGAVGALAVDDYVAGSRPRS